MSEIKEVTKYLTSDGVEYSDLEKALERQAVINFKGWYNTLKEDGWGSDADSLSTWILKNKGAVLTLLGYEDMI